MDAEADGHALQRVNTATIMTNKGSIFLAVLPPALTFRLAVAIFLLNQLGSGARFKLSPTRQEGAELA
jgi:hypothetical protein